MSNSGSSGKPLVDKLGFAAGDSIYVEDTPDWYTQFANENQLALTPELPATHVHLFCDSHAQLEAFLKENQLSDIEKSLWISWPKKSSGKQTNLAENDLRELLLPLGWVDVKVAAIDEVWSGYKFVRRKNRSPVS